MEHKKISQLLRAAGWIALAGVVFVFYLSTPLRIAMDGGMLPWGYMAFKAIAGVPYLLALGHYFRICENIGADRSFCGENARWMRRIAQLLTAAAAFWLIALLMQVFGLLRGVLTGVMFTDTILVCVDLLAMMASLAVALVAKMMGHLVDRAVRLQEDSDLTI